MCLLAVSSPLLLARKALPCLLQVAKEHILDFLQWIWPVTRINDRWKIYVNWSCCRTKSRKTSLYSMTIQFMNGIKMSFFFPIVPCFIIEIVCWLFFCDITHPRLNKLNGQFSGLLFLSFRYSLSENSELEYLYVSMSVVHLGFEEK